jgi:hypothetical protein
VVVLGELAVSDGASMLVGDVSLTCSKLRTFEYGTNVTWGPPGGCEIQ